MSDGSPAAEAAAAAVAASTVAASTAADVAVADLLGGVLSATTPSGDRVLLHTASGTYLRLGGAAGAVVDLLAAHGSEEAASAALAARYGLPRERAVADVRGVVERLSALRPVRPAGGRPCPASVACLAVQWVRLPRHQRLTAAGMLLLLGVVEAGLRCTDVVRLASTLGVPLAGGAGDPPPCSDLSELLPAQRRRMLALDWALGRWWAPATCLRRALATGFVLRRRSPVLRLGMTADGVTAHAWVEAGGRSHDPGRPDGIFRAVR